MIIALLHRHSSLRIPCHCGVGEVLIENQELAYMNLTPIDRLALCALMNLTQIYMDLALRMTYSPVILASLPVL